MPETFLKRTYGRPAEWEQAGLAWLAEAEAAGGAEVVRVLARGDDGLTENHVSSVAPSARFAAEFGQRLAATHTLTAGVWGEGPAGWSGPGYQGPNDHLLELSLTPHESWGAMYSAERVLPLVRQLDMGTGDRAVFERLGERLAAGDFDTADAPARLHGDLWAGNVLWAERGCVLIDPSAHVGHRETDLAALALFGCDHLARILAAYDAAHPLADGWRERVGLHQLSMVLMHAVVFGGGYAAQALAIARRYA